MTLNRSFANAHNWKHLAFASSPSWFIIGLVLGLLTTALDIYQLLKRFAQFK
jgi:hypothetical protein